MIQLVKTMMSDSLTLFVIKALLAIVYIITSSQSHAMTCQSRPFQYPEMYLDYHTCSTVFDWSRAITDNCQDNFKSYEVELVNECHMKTINTENELNVFREYIPGQCLASENCYVRVRARLKDNSWSRNGTWIGLSDKYRMFHGKTA